MKPSHLILASLLVIALLVVLPVQAAEVTYPYDGVYATDHDAVQVPTLAFDKNLDTYWASATPSENPKILGIDYGGSPRLINQYNLSSINPSYGGKRWYVYGSNDNATFQMIDSRVVVDHPVWPATSWEQFECQNTENVSTYRYYRVDFISYYGSNMIENEMEYVYNDTIVRVPFASFSSTNKSIATNSTASGWEGVAPFTMQFVNTSTKPPHTSFVWNYTEISAPTIPVTFNETAYYNPIYTFTSAGNYSIALNVTNAYGADISTQVTWVNVSSGVEIPIVKWVKSKIFVMFPDSLYFNDTSENEPTARNWSFGNGKWYNATDATALNYSYQYRDRGRFSPYLIVSNAAGSNTSATQTVEVMGYQGFIPLIKDRCMYSTSRPLSIMERLMTDCKICGVC